jgi:hypothetical protein
MTNEKSDRLLGEVNSVGSRTFLAKRSFDNLNPRQVEKHSKSLGPSAIGHSRRHSGLKATLMSDFLPS